MLSLVLPAAASLAVVLVCTGMVLALSRDSAPVARHRPEALTLPPIVPPTVPPMPKPQPEPEAAAFDPLTSPLDDVEQFLAELGVTNDMTTTHVYAEALAEDRDRVIAEDTRELETVQ